MADQPNILRRDDSIDPETGKPFPTPGQPEEHNFPGEYVPSSRKECDDENAGAGGGFGKPATLYPYIWYGNINRADYEELQACDPFYHKTAQIDSLQINTSDGIIGTGAINISGTIASLTRVQAPIGSFGTKTFDIPHPSPSKKDKRLVHGCLEGPELGVYIRGRLTGGNVIQLPDYWQDLVDPETITVTLTQIRTSQDLIVDAIEWGRRIKIKSGNASAIDCFYTVNATRKDVPPLEVEPDA